MEGEKRRKEKNCGISIPGCGVSVFVNRGAGSLGAAYQHKQREITGGADGVKAPSIRAEEEEGHGKRVVGDDILWVIAVGTMSFEVIVVGTMSFGERAVGTMSL